MIIDCWKHDIINIMPIYYKASTHHWMLALMCGYIKPVMD